MKRIEANIVNPYGSEGFKFQPNTSGNVSSILIKKLCHSAEISMAELVRRRNELHPNDKTTPQNLSNKLSRDSLKLAEFIELANCAGFNVVFEEIEKDNRLLDLQGNPLSAETTEIEMDVVNESMPRSKEITPIRQTTKSFDELLAEGYCESKTVNLGLVIIAGAKCKEAAQWIAEHLTSDMDDLRERMTFARANRKFNVKWKHIEKNLAILLGLIDDENI